METTEHTGIENVLKFSGQVTSVKLHGRYAPVYFVSEEQTVRVSVVCPQGLVWISGYSHSIATNLSVTGLRRIQGEGKNLI